MRSFAGARPAGWRCAAALSLVAFSPFQRERHTGVCAPLTPVGGCLVVGQYLILANGARGRAGVALIQQAISNPQLFHFGELIDHENIAALDGARATPVPAAHVDALGRTCSTHALRARHACQCSTSLSNLLMENCLFCAIAV